jgi:AraC-like DNA-binding protein
MPGRALPEKVKQQLISQEHDERVHAAVAAYVESKEAFAAGKIPKKLSLRKVASNFGVSHSQVDRVYKGGRTIAEANREDKGLLTKIEELILVDEIEVSAERGMPLPIPAINLAVNALLIAKQGGDYRPCGKNWVDRFLQRHRQRLKTHWGHKIDGLRANALNPGSVAHWFNEVVWPNIQGCASSACATASLSEKT